MTRRRAVDWVLIVALTGVWAVLFTRGIQDGVRTGRGALRLGVSSAAGADAYPRVLWYRPTPALAPGDVLVALDGKDLRGSSALRFHDVATRSARERGHALVTARRIGSTSTFERVLTLTPMPFWWTALVFSAALMASGLALLVWAPGWHLSRQAFVASWCFAAGMAAYEIYGGQGGDGLQVTLGRMCFAFGSALTVWNLQDFSPSAPAVPRLQRGLGLAAGALFLVTYLFDYHLPLTSTLRFSLVVASTVGLAVAVLFAATRTYWWSERLERRRLRWLVLGFYVGMLGSVLGTLVSTGTLFRDPFGADGRAVARVVQSTLGLATPIGLIASVFWYRWLDVDRLISATASYTIVGFSALGAALALVPRAAAAAAPVLGVDAASAQWLLNMALVGAAAFAAHRYLRPRLDQQMFAERHRRMSGLETLHDELASCSGAEEIWELASERLDALLEPESLVVFARDGDRFAPRFARGGEASQLYDANSVLVRALERRGRPLAADSSELDPFDRAALETLGVALIVPIRVDERLLAFACLGRRRSGDIYTPQDTSQLATLATRCAELVSPTLASRAAPPQVFRREGELWTISSRGKQVHLRDMRGLHYLATLLREPRREFDALDLVRAASGLAFVNGATPERGLRVVRQLSDAAAVLDAQARNEYRKRVSALEAELADAESCADLGRLERASAEREALLAELGSTSRGRHSPTGSDSERARVAVTKAIKLALEKITEAHPELGAHLAATIRRGYACAYEPDPRVPVEWEV